MITNTAVVQEKKSQTDYILSLGTGTAGETSICNASPSGGNAGRDPSRMLNGFTGADKGMYWKKDKLL